MDKEQIKDIIDNSKSAALLLDENAQEHEFLAREALRIALEEKGLTVYQFPEAPESFIAKWLLILGSYEKPSLFSSTSILIPKNRFDIKEINYEENENFFVLNVHSENSDIKKDDIFFESKPVSIEAVFCMGNPCPSPENHLKRFSTPEQKKIAHLTQTGTFAQNIFEIIKNIFGDIRRENHISMHSLLMASLMCETEELKEGLNKNVLSLAANLLDAGANFQTINNIIHKDRSPSFAQIFGRALARTRVNKQLKSVWTFISEEDLQKTNNLNPKQSLFQQILRQTKNNMPPQPLYILLWQIKNTVWGMIASEEKDKYLLENLGLKLGSQIKNNFLPIGPYQNFSEAELKLQYSLKELVS